MTQGAPEEHVATGRSIRLANHDPRIVDRLHLKVRRW